MSISTYSELKTAVADWLNRRDLTAVIPNFVQLAEARMNRDVRLRVRDAIERDTLAVSGQVTTLPTDYAQMVNVENQSATPVYPLEPATPLQMDVTRNLYPTGNPQLYCIIGTELEAVPVPTSAITLGIIYYKRIVPLSDSATTNWLLTAAPDIYLSAVMAFGCPYLKEDDRLIWEASYNRFCDDYLTSSQASTGESLVMRANAIG